MLGIVSWEWNQESLSAFTSEVECPHLTLNL